MINVFQPSIGEEEIAEVAKVLQSQWLGSGHTVRTFESTFAEHLLTPPRHFVSTTCGTEAIFLAAELFRFKKDDEVIAPSISFIGVGNAIVRRKARLVICDVDRQTLNVTVEYIARKLTKKTKAVFVTHYGGVPCDMDPILQLCRDHNIIVIEDSACALKSYYKGNACGTLGDMGLWSFDPAKGITTGDGGMAYFPDIEHVRRAKEYLHLGLPATETSGMERLKAGTRAWWEVQIETPGHRAIMNNIAGAIGLAQLNKIDRFIARRRAIDEHYRNELAACSWLELPPIPEKHSESSHYFFWIQLEQRDKLAHFLRQNGVYSTFRYWPLHKVRFFKHPGGGLPNAEYASRHTLNLPIHPDLSEDEVSKVIALIKRFGRAR
jgi:dTDP-4-amino-4,6-dideoxygalactose transaminase